ncbi:MAG: haloacid dehalogenase type II [Gammaproteobacteria bacterium]
MNDSPLGGIEVCVFDAYGTLFDVHAAAAQCRDALGDRADTMSTIWRDKQLQYTWLRTLMHRYVDFWQVTGDALDFALERVGIDDAALRDRLMDIYRTLSAYPEVPRMLERLRDAGMKTAILSNGAPSMLDSAVDNAGISGLLDAVLSVEALGVYKPDPRVYQMASDHFRVAPPAVCFLSSNAWDISGAATFGFSAVWVNRTGQPAERLPGTPVAQLTSLETLPELLNL